MKKQGAIILGIGGDNSPWAQGDFFEGVLTSGAATDATASAVQANIAAAGYGK
jgi:non-reducing end alpha-L-arabinofuranosidase